ncbi:MAG: hypothetical protein ACYDCJ_02385 [Gammaproteobacteria bacterium]
MLKFAVDRWIAGVCAVGATLALFGCSSSKPYTLVAQLQSLSQQGRIVAATIDVVGDSCSVRIMLLDSLKAWTPLCFVKQDQTTYKSLLIGGQEVDFGAVGTSFKVLSTTMPTLPASALSNSATPSGGSGAGFPSQWNQSPYPGHVKLEGQNSGFMVTKATLTINGSQGILNVIYKVGYAPLHLECTVLANQRGDFTLMFNPTKLAKLSAGAHYDIPLSSEGSSISGNIWDSRGFDTWTPSLPPQWTAASYSSN